MKRCAHFAGAVAAGLLALLVMLAGARVCAGEPYLVKDIPSIPEPLDLTMPRQLAAAGDVLYLSAMDVRRERSMWVTDGSATGTQRLRANAAAGGGDLYFDSGVLMGGRFVFLTFNSPELWRSDGPQAGAARLTTFPTNDGMKASGLVTAGSRAYLWRSKAGLPLELWVSDGFATGTQRVTTLGASSAPAAGEQAVLGNRLVFGHWDAGHGNELWISDGTVAGTTFLKDLLPGSAGAAPFALTTVGNAVYGFATMADGQKALWRSDGSPAGTAFVKTVTPTVEGTGEVPRVAHAGELFFAAQDAEHGAELWKSDGTAAGTVMVKDICAGTTGSTPEVLVSTANGVCFLAKERTELWRSDGTEAGTWRVWDVSQCGDPYHSMIEAAMPYGSGLLLVVGATIRNGCQDSTELWISDGTPAGTHQLLHYASAYQCAVAGDRIFFDRAADAHTMELWTSDGTEPGTRRVPLRGGIQWGSRPSVLTEMDGKLYFRTEFSAGGKQLWRSDGTEAGTVPLKALDFTALQRFELPRGSAAEGRRLIFAANDGEHGAEPWISDGTVSGTMMLADIQAGMSGSEPGSFVQAGGRVYFDATRADCGRELWSTDGTAQDTGLTRDLQPGTSGSTFTERVAVGDALYFISTLATGARVLGRSDGSAAGTGYVASGAGEPYSNPSRLGGLGTQVLFLAQNSSASLALWKIDTASTSVPRQVVQLAQPGAYRLESKALVAGGFYFFGLNDGVHGLQLWRSDGTAAGTKRVKDVNPITTSAYLDLLLVHRGRVIFVAGDSSGLKVWISDGTAGGTTERFAAGDVPPTAWADFERYYCWTFSTYGESRLWCDDGGINGALNLGRSEDAQVASAYGWIYLSKRDDESGEELWQVRAATGAMHRLGDINPGNVGSRPADMTVVGNRLFFSAGSQVNDLGSELWAVDLSSAARPADWLNYE